MQGNFIHFDVKNNPPRDDPHEDLAVLSLVAAGASGLMRANGGMEYIRYFEFSNESTPKKELSCIATLISLTDISQQINSCHCSCWTYG